MKFFHYKNDFSFDISLTSVTTGERIDASMIKLVKLYTRKSGRCYVACFDNETLIDNGDTVKVVLNKHGLEPGVLFYTVIMDIPDQVYPDRMKHIEQTYVSEIELVIGNGSTEDIDVQAMFGNTIDDKFNSYDASILAIEIKEDALSEAINNTYTKAEVDQKITEAEIGDEGIEIVDNLKVAIEQLRDSLTYYAFSGSKPEFSWENVTPEPVTVHTVTWTLYGLTMQGSTSVEDGETWIGTITPNKGYLLPSELDSVEGDYGVLTYENGVVTITNVTSNIAIVASGIETAVLTSPENGTTFNIGNIEMDETTVSNMLLVKGNNITKPVSISVSGEDITVSTNVLTAAEVNTGTNITLTYTNNVEIKTTVTGSLTISSDEVSTTIAVTASKTALTYYNIINTLTNVTNSNADTSVVENSSYSATLSPTLARHILDDENITITMGDVDITEDVYSDGEINIAEVTGDVVITANTITYVTNGLVMHLDYNTIDLDNNKWTSLVTTTDANDEPLTYEFDLENVTTSANGAVFNGTNAKATSLQTMDISPNDGTIEYILGGITPDTTMVNGIVILRNATATYGIGAVTWNYSGNKGVTRQWAVKNASGLDGFKFDNYAYMHEHYSGNNAYAAINGIQTSQKSVPTATFNYYADVAGDQLNIAWRKTTSSETFSPLNLKGLRVYNRQLTAEEAAQNYKVDKKLFNLG